MKQAERPALHRWTRRECARLIEHGFLEEDDEIHREPAQPGPARRRWGYIAIQTLGADAAVAPLAAPSARVPVADLLP
jgi:hypothetical protein